MIGHEESEAHNDVSHLWAHMDTVSDSKTDRSHTQKTKILNEREGAFDSRLLESNVSSNRNQPINTGRTNSYTFHDGEHSIVNASQYVASTTFSELQRVQDDFDDLQ